MYCLAGTFNSGGMERIVIGKANWLASHGYDVSIVTTEQNGKQNFFQLSDSVRRIDLDITYSENNTYNPIKKLFVRRKKMRRHLKELQKLVEYEKPDMIISTFGNEVAIIPKLKNVNKKIAEIHFSRWYRLQLNRKGIWRVIDKYLTHQDYRILHKYDKFICLTHEDSKNWKNLNNVVVIPNFVDVNYGDKAKLLANRMIAVGRLSYQKGYDRMIKAWKIVNTKHPDWTLVIFGDGELKSEIAMQIENYGLNGSIILNNPTENIKHEYLNSSALLLSSHYEGLPMVLLEAMSYGLPLISFDCQCGPGDVILDGVNGYLIKDGDIDGMAKKINKLIESYELRKVQGKESFKMAINYSPNIIMKKWDLLFNSLIK